MIKLKEGNWGKRQDYLRKEDYNKNAQGRMVIIKSIVSAIEGINQWGKPRKWKRNKEILYFLKRIYLKPHIFDIYRYWMKIKGWEKVNLAMKTKTMVEILRSDNTDLKAQLVQNG